MGFFWVYPCKTPYFNGKAKTIRTLFNTAIKLYEKGIAPPFYCDSYGIHFLTHDWSSAPNEIRRIKSGECVLFDSYNRPVKVKYDANGINSICNYYHSDEFAIRRPIADSFKDVYMWGPLKEGLHRLPISNEYLAGIAAMQILQVFTTTENFGSSQLRREIIDEAKYCHWRQSLCREYDFLKKESTKRFPRVKLFYKRDYDLRAYGKIDHRTLWDMEKEINEYKAICDADNRKMLSRRLNKTKQTATQSAIQLRALGLMVA